MFRRFHILVLVISITFIYKAGASGADTGVIPKDLVLNQRWNYNEYTDMVMPVINWLQNTPIDTNNDLRTRHNNFLMYWLQKNEDVVVHMPEYLLTFQNASRELYFIYTGGWIKHTFVTGDSTRKGNGQAAVSAVLDFYERDMGVPQNDYLDHLLSIQKNGELSNLFDSSETGKHTYIFLKSPADKHDFKPGENYFQFKYTGINFTNTRALRYRYKLDGYYDKWIYTDEQTVTFPKLPPGNYNFIVQASIYPDFVPAVEDSYSFNIATPFYLQAWFIIAVILLIILLGVWYMKRREKQLKQIAELKNDKISFEYEYLKSQVNPHFLFNSLNTLTSLIEDSPKKAVTYTSHLSDLYRNMLAHPDRNLVYLSEELEILENYIHIQKSRFGASLQVNIDIPKDIRDNKRVVYLALQLLVENAIKHNVVAKATPLIVDIFTDNEELVVSNPVRDKVSKEKSSRLGLANITKRYALNTKRKVSYGIQDHTYVVRLPLL